MRCVFVLCMLGLGCALDKVGWYVVGAQPFIEPEVIPWKFYTHVVFGAPAVDQFGVATCNKSDTIFPRSSNEYVQDSTCPIGSSNWRDSMDRKLCGDPEFLQPRPGW